MFGTAFGNNRNHCIGRKLCPQAGLLKQTNQGSIVALAPVFPAFRKALFQFERTVVRSRLGGNQMLHGPRREKQLGVFDREYEHET